MKNTGIMRNLDGLGRVVLPKELRESLSLEQGDALEIHVDGNDIILRPHRAECMCCGESELDNLGRMNGVVLCKRCAEHFHKQLNGGA